MRHGRDWIVRRSFALPFLPAFIRTGIGPFRSGYWIRWGKYTRVLVWNERLGRYRTTHTFPGWVTDDEIKGNVPEFVQ